MGILKDIAMWLATALLGAFIIVCALWWLWVVLIVAYVALRIWG